MLVANPLKGESDLNDGGADVLTGRLIEQGRIAERRAGAGPVARSAEEVAAGVRLPGRGGRRTPTAAPAPAALHVIRDTLKSMAGLGASAGLPGSAMAQPSPGPLVFCSC